MTSKVRCHAVQSSHAVQQVFGGQMLFFDALNRMETCEPHDHALNRMETSARGVAPHTSLGLYTILKLWGLSEKICGSCGSCGSMRFRGHLGIGNATRVAG